MLTNPAAILLAVILVLLPLRACAANRPETIRTGKPAEGLDSITWTAAVANDGRLAIRIDYTFTDDEPRNMDIRLPKGARYLAVNGKPTPADTGVYATATVSRLATITYELPGRVARYSDGAVVQLAGAYGDGDLEFAAQVGSAGIPLRLDGDQAMFVCPRCYLENIGYGDTPVSGAIYAPGAAQAELLFAGLEQPRSQASTGASGQASSEAILFAGVDPGTDAVSMLAVIPASAVPDLARRDGSADDAVMNFRDRFDDPNDVFRNASPPAGKPSSTAAVLLFLLVAGLGLAFVLGWVWNVGTERSARRAADLAGVPGDRGPAISPGNLEAALAGLVVGDRGSGRASVIAATILELARREILTISGSDERRFTLTVPAGATGETTFENAVIAQLRPLGTAPDAPVETVLTGPPLWHTRAPAVTRSLEKALIREGLKQRLVHLNRPLALAAPVSIAMGVVALIGVDGVTIHAWIAIIIGPLLAALALKRSGVSLTAAGKRHRDEWSAYAAVLHRDPELANAAPMSIHELGKPLVYAAALGAAPVAAEALSSTHAVER